MNEKVVVMGNIPNYRPKFNNYLQKFAEKQDLRKVILDEIINLNFTNGIAPLIKIMDGISESEINEIINMWHIFESEYDNYDYKKLICLYEEPLRSKDLLKIEIADLYFYENIEKFKKSLGRG